MNEETRRSLIENYVRAYNSFDIEAMLANLHDRIVFVNVSGGERTLELEGIDAFRLQAQNAADFFSEREQTIKSFTFGENECEIEIGYRATFAADLPNGFKKGDVIELTGKSIFRFADGKISAITDIS